METLIREALRGLEHILHLGDMTIAEEAGARRSDGRTRVVRGLYVGDSRNGTMVLRVHRGDIETVRPSRPPIIQDKELSESEREWVPMMRRHIANALHAHFTLPGADELTQTVRDTWSDGILERIEAPDSTHKRQRWVVFWERIPIGVYTYGGYLSETCNARTWVDLIVKLHTTPRLAAG
jgi:hypothetical protein